MKQFSSFLIGSVILGVALVLFLHVKEKTVSEEAFFIDAINIMEENVVNRSELDWKSIQHKTSSYLTHHDKRTTAVQLLTLLGTNRGIFKTKNGATFAHYSKLTCAFEHNEIRTVPEHIGYIRVDSTSKLNRRDYVSRATEIQHSIRAQDKKNLKGWIVDLRFNDGGPMYPMISGLGPLFGNATLGYFIDENKQQNDNKHAIAYGYFDGATLVSYDRTKVTEPYITPYPNKPVVVLTSELTSRSAEAVAIAFKKQRGAVQIGDKTCGMATRTKKFKLADGSSLVLAVSKIADREKNTYEAGVPPDIELNAKEALEYAVAYLNSLEYAENE